LPPVERAMKAQALGATPGYRVEEGDCSNCERTTLTIRALWTGHVTALLGRGARE
jgi:hypothetical protein